MEQDNGQSIRSLAEAYPAAWYCQDAESVAAFYEVNGSLNVNEDAPAVGREVIIKVTREFITAFPE